MVLSGYMLPLEANQLQWDDMEGKEKGKDPALMEEAITAVFHASSLIMAKSCFLPPRLPISSPSCIILSQPRDPHRLLEDTFAFPLSQHLPMQSVGTNKLCSKKNLPSFPPSPHPNFHGVMINWAQKSVLCFAPPPRWLRYAFVALEFGTRDVPGSLLGWNGGMQASSGLCTHNLKYCPG